MIKKHLWLQFAHTDLLKGVPSLVLIILIRYFKSFLLGVCIKFYIQENNIHMIILMKSDPFFT